MSDELAHPAILAMPKDGQVFLVRCSAGPDDLARLTWFCNTLVNLPSGLRETLVTLSVENVLQPTEDTPLAMDATEKVRDLLMRLVSGLAVSTAERLAVAVLSGDKDAAGPLADEVQMEFIAGHVTNHVTNHVTKQPVAVE